MKRIGLVALAVLAALAGCGKQLASVLRPNQPPEVVVTASRVSTAKGGGSEFLVSWTGFDRDGRIDHFLVAENPVSVDRVDASWKRTAEFGIRLRSRAIGLESESPGAPREPRTVVVRAVDDRGAISDAGSISFFGANIAPTVQIVSPRPSPLIIPVVPESFRVSWTGSDPDGQTTTRPVKYKFILLNAASEFGIDVARGNPDSLRRYYAPTFAGWDSTGGDSTSVLYRNLVPSQMYLFAVVAIDEVGDYSPVFSLSTNMLQFRVGFAKLLGPRITLFNESFNYTPPTGGFVNDPSRYARLETVPDRTVDIHWIGTPQQGADIVGYRWVLDPIDLYDETTRTSPGDVHHWSARDLTTSATLGPFYPIVKSETHLLFVDALDSFGSRGLGIVKITALKSAPLDQGLLIVDDTRMTPDSYFPSGCPRPPLGTWPTAAELDTFLYARGGVPWRCYPAGTVSTPGLFNGYRYDTLGTRTGRADLTVPLSTLVKYSHVIWMTDDFGAQRIGTGGDPVNPSTALRYMSSPGRFNSLAAYVAGGGHLWLAGSGTALAGHLPWDDRNNNTPAGRFVFSSSIPRELGPGRLMYELPFWRSAFAVQKASLRVQRFGGRLEGTPQIAGLPAQLDLKGVAPPDPMPPYRSNPSQFYLTSVDVAFLFEDNDVVEGTESTLDSLYEGVGASLPQPGDPDYHNVLMTHYHGSTHGPVIFTGFNFWDFKRAQCKQLVDYVLQQMWGLTPSAPAMVDDNDGAGSGSDTDSPRTTTWQRVRAAMRR